MVQVEGEPNRDSAPGGVLECPGDETFGLIGEAEVVDRDVERALPGGDEVREGLGDLDRRLAAVGECPDLDQPDCCAFMRALYARLASW
jgi:hypothetical protein